MASRAPGAKNVFAQILAAAIQSGKKPILKNVGQEFGAGNSATQSAFANTGATA